MPLLACVVSAVAYLVVTSDEPADGGRAVAGQPSSTPASTSAAPEVPVASADPVDACREVILALNDITSESVGPWPPLSASAAATVEGHGQTVARMRPLLRPAEKALVDSASDAIDTLLLGDGRSDPLGTLRTVVPALDSACTA